MARKQPLVFKTATDEYVSGTQLGAGGAGTVYEATDGSGGLVAVKVLNPENVSSDKRKRFKNELKFGAVNRHPNILTITDSGICTLKDADVPFYVMPRYSGTLRGLIARGIATTHVLGLFAQVLDGVEGAHKLDVMHRDLKPENVLHNASTGTLVVADFGVARFTADKLHTLVETRGNARLANFEYAAPEQRRKGATVDLRADIFALGLMLNEMLTGEVAHGAGYRTIGSIAPGLAYLDEIVERMIQQDPAKRPASIAEVKSQLIARGNHFVAQQKLDELRRTVVPVSEITDPMVNDPPQLIGVDYRDRHLVFKLSKSISREWSDAFRTGEGARYIPGHGPRDIAMEGDTLRVRALPGQEQLLVDMFKEYVAAANRVYERTIRQRLETAQQEERNRLRQQAKEEQTRLELLGRIKL